MISHVFEYQKKKNISILEPGCGDGRIVRPLMEYLYTNGVERITLDLVEKDINELEKAISVLKNYKDIINDKSKFIARDYLNFHFENKKKYDLILGNPPYIKKSHLTKSQRILIRNIHELAGLKSFVKNIWTAFLISAVQKLKKGGGFALILPSELLQTSYSEEIREFILKRFNKVEIFTFKELIFKGIEQDVVILFATGRSDNGCEQLEYIQLQNLNCLDNINKSKSSIHNFVNGTKWTNYTLSSEELAFLKKLKSSLSKIDDYCNTSPGIVTAANSFFIVNKDFVEDKHLKQYAKKILQKSSFSQNKIIIGKEEWTNIQKKGLPCYFLNFTLKPTLSESARIYLQHGEDEYIDKRYKCLRRHPWYAIPSPCASEGIYAKRSGIYPRMMLNEENLLVTDSFYNIFMKIGFSVTDLIYSFYNRLTFIFAELTGRQYGGGVLELTPKEFRSLPIFFVKSNHYQLNDLNNKLKNKGIDNVLETTDKDILQDALGLSSDNIEILVKIHKKLLEKRLKK
jgi:adenine-specific DNA-methyltransferase